MDNNVEVLDGNPKVKDKYRMMAREYRVMAVAENYCMIRAKGSFPFVVSFLELKNSYYKIINTQSK